MPSRNFCDQCADEIPREDSYFTVRIVEVNLGKYQPVTTTITDGHTVPIQGSMEMVCRRCARKVHTALFSKE